MTLANVGSAQDLAPPQDDGTPAVSIRHTPAATFTRCWPVAAVGFALVCTIIWWGILLWVTAKALDLVFGM